MPCWQRLIPTNRAPHICRTATWDGHRDRHWRARKIVEQCGGTRTACSKTSTILAVTCMQISSAPRWSCNMAQSDGPRLSDELSVHRAGTGPGSVVVHAVRTGRPSPLHPCSRLRISVTCPTRRSPTGRSDLRRPLALNRRLLHGVRSGARTRRAQSSGDCTQERTQLGARC